MNTSVLNNKNCFLTGATGGLGEQIAVQLAKRNCNLFLTATNKKNFENLSKKILAVNNDISVFYEPADLSNLEDIKNLINKSHSAFDTIDVLVNCAGILPIKLLSDSTLDDFEKCISINIKAPFIFTKEFSNDMKKNNWGRIVNIASSGAYNGQKKTLIYRATKHALLGFSKACHKELRAYNVRTFCISPGPMKTKMGESIVPKLNNDEDYSTFIDPKDVAEFIIFLISFDNELFAEEIRLQRIIGEK